MPKDEFDFQDPFELNGQVVLTDEDTTDAMCECFIEEFVRLGYSAQRIYGLFGNPHYLGMHLVWQKRGPRFVRDAIAEMFARRGRTVSWPDPLEQRPPGSDAEPCPAPQSIAADDRATDPMGAPVPQINL